MMARVFGLVCCALFVCHGFVVRHNTLRQSQIGTQQWALRGRPPSSSRGIVARTLRRILKKRWWFPRPDNIDASSNTVDTYNGTISIDSTQEEEASFATRTFNYPLPKGTRWAVTTGTNLSGLWRPIVSNAFRQEYDEYLKNCSQSVLFRKVCLSVIGLTKEEIYQTDHGRSLQIIGTTPAGNWARTLVASGADFQHQSFEPLNVTFQDPDKDKVHVESWWEGNGTIHKSWLRGKPRVCGGAFESTRFLSGGILHCESRFHPNGAPSKFRPGVVLWRFQKECDI